MTVGIVGYGYVGQAIEQYMSSECRTKVYDINKPELDTLEDVVHESNVIFACVPTPMNADGSCYTGIVESVLDDIMTVSKSLDRDANEFIVVLKSTVTPGFTKSQQARTGLRLIFSPEFLTEKNSIEDFENGTRIILGGDEDDARIVYKMFERKTLVKKTWVVQCDSTEAEMVKLFTNVFLAMKVTYANELYKLCGTLDIDYDTVKTLSSLDKRIAPSHLDVPGRDGDVGYGGSCFVKDVSSMKFVCKAMMTGEKLISAMIERNDEVRTDRNWERMKGRAIVDDTQE